MLKNSKSIVKSVRLSEKVYDFVLSMPGRGFTKKFEYIVLRFMDEQPKLEKKLAELEQQISTRQKQLDQISQKVTALDITVESIFSLQDEIHEIQRQIKLIVNME